jgi:putative addiction module component (TIGR02574 family)
MFRDVDSILHDVRELDPEQQVELAEKIMAGVSQTPEIEDATREEIHSRAQAYHRGELKAEDASQMFARVREMITQARNNR